MNPHDFKQASATRTGWRVAIISCLLILAGSILHAIPSARAAAPSPRPFQSSGAAHSVWDDATVPGTTDTQVDSNAVELGMKFRSSVSGYVTGVRFYKGATNT